MVGKSEQRYYRDWLCQQREIAEEIEWSKSLCISVPISEAPKTGDNDEDIPVPPLMIVSDSDDDDSNDEVFIALS